MTMTNTRLSMEDVVKSYKEQWMIERSFPTAKVIPKDMFDKSQKAGMDQSTCVCLCSFPDHIKANREKKGSPYPEVPGYSLISRSHL